MNGVTIVAEHFCRVIEIEELIGFGIFIALLSIGGLLFYWWSYKYYNQSKKEKITLLICSILIIISNIGYWITQINKYNTTHIEYTVITDNSVGINDFYEKYEIVSMNGNEFRVIEK